MSMLPLALKAGLPLIHVKTDDILHVEEILSFIAGETVRPIQVPKEIEGKISDLKIPSGRVFSTSSQCDSLKKLYHFCSNNEKTIVFINTEKSVLQFDGGALVPPVELVREVLAELSEDPDSLLPAFGGLTLKDVKEVARLTMTRDESLTSKGVNETRRGYRNLRGITPVDTTSAYYQCPSYLNEWLAQNTKFFLEPVHEALVPRGLLFGGEPGTGKTMASKHIANQFGVPLYRLDIGAMKGKYVGDSEQNLLAALSQVDQVEPCVVIFDEVEKLFQSQADSGVTSSLLSQLLWWLQEHKTQVFTVMTTNDIKKIPPELYREGRVDETMNFMGVEGFKDGTEFARGAFDAMAAQVGGNVDFTLAHKELAKRVKVLYSESAAVPQSRLTQETYSLLREILSQ